MFFPLHFWGVNNMYWESEGGKFLHPWRKGGTRVHRCSLKRERFSSTAKLRLAFYYENSIKHVFAEFASTG